MNTNEDTDHVFAAADFNYSPGESGDPLASVKITGLPATGTGTLTLDGTPLLIETDLPVTVTVDDLTANKLKYSPPLNANGLAYARFRFKVNDGADDSAASYTIIINVGLANTPATGAPTITATVGPTLTAVTTAIRDANGLTNVSYTYQWIWVDGGTETNISGATASTYMLTAADLGKTIKVKVSFTDDTSNHETADQRGDGGHLGGGP